MNIRELFKRKFQFKDTCCLILSDSEHAINSGISSIKHNRKILDMYVCEHPKFLYALDPVFVERGPKVAKLMAEYAEKANVGPMAAVAGVIADLAVEEMVKTGCQVAVVENGGEISAASKRPIDTALLAGDHPLSKRFGFRLEEFPVGVATSSGVFSHAFSFGEAEAVTVFAVKAGLADAAATAVGNLIKGENEQEAIEQGIRTAMKIDGVRGVFVIYRNHVGVCGQVPKFVKIKN